MRIIGFILLAVLIVPNLTLRRRLPPKVVSGGLVNIRVFKSPVFSTYCLAIWVTFLGLYTGELQVSLRVCRSLSNIKSVYLQCSPT